MHRPNVLLVFLSAAGLAACSPQSAEQVGQTSSGAAATSAATASVEPSPQARRPNLARVVDLVTSASSTAPSPVASASTTPFVTPAPIAQKHVVVPMRAPNAPPQIVDVEVNSTNVGSGDTLWGKVLTSSNVASVEVRVANVGVGLNKVGVGRFMLTYRLGSIPFFAHGTYPMYVIARNSRGDRAERTLELTIH